MKTKILKRVLFFLITIVLILIITTLVVYFNLPTTRLNYTSELVMLGDLDNNYKWDKNDIKALNEYLDAPFDFSNTFAYKIDVNKNGKIDREDTLYIKALCTEPDPYKISLDTNGSIFPRPREFFRYLPATEYIQRPLYTLKHPIAKNSPFEYILDSAHEKKSQYEMSIMDEIYDECLHLTFRFNTRKESLTEIEQKYAIDKFEACRQLYKNGKLYDLLLMLIGLVEDAETITTNNQSIFMSRILVFREHLRELLNSDLYKSYKKGETKHSTILDFIEKLLKNDLKIAVDIDQLPPPRDFSNLKNYLDRAEWQYYKTKIKEGDFEKLVLFAQYNRRYLRAVANTSRKHEDKEVQNHNLPMILLYREALSIMNGDNKAAVGMLDEAIRIPFSWVKSIPAEMLPNSIASNNFLLPGNKEDGADKSRHWNVFGGISLYRSPENALKLSLQREISDFKKAGKTTEAMDEFIRDLISNINGIYYVSSIKYQPIQKEKQQ